MNTMTIALSTVKERTRRFSFWAMVGLTLAAAFLMVPTEEITGFNVLLIEPQLYLQGGNSTWVPMATALCMSVFLQFFGFPYIKGMITLDRQTGTMDMLLAGGVGRFRYVFGKMLAGFSLLCMLLGVAAAGSLLTTLIRYQGLHMDLWTFFSPFLALIPGLLFISALSMLFETSALFRSGRMNALAMTIFFILYLFSMMAGIMATLETAVSGNGISFDFTGMGLITVAINLASLAATGQPSTSITVMGSGVASGGTTQLYFEGLQKTLSTLGSLVLIIAAALLLTFVAALALERHSVSLFEKPEKKKVKTSAAYAVQEPWHPVPSGRYRFAAIVNREFHRITKGLGFKWFIAALGLWIAGWAVDYNTAKNVLLPLAMGWAILPLSNLGSEEQNTGIVEQLQTIPGAPMRQAAACGLSGFLLCLVITLPVLIRSFTVSLPVTFLLPGFALMLPLTALALGTYTRTERTYQILLLLFLYLVLNAADYLLPVSGMALTIGTVYFLIAGFSFVLVFLDKRKRGSVC